uniref:MSP domain-containing protein n=1 Tax=Peronospora matthiolae TaxID=2874970 RepID=A0AAV1TDJ8_9STRA
MASIDVDVALAPHSCVLLEPADSLCFRLPSQLAAQEVLTIRNVSSDRQIAFKVKTTRPLRYLVRPNQGLLGPNGSASIVVILQKKECEELRRMDPAERQLSNDKFLVQSIYVDERFYEQVKTKSTKEMADELTHMWARTDKRALSNKKLRCRFVQEDEDAEQLAVAPSSPQRTTSTNASSATTAVASDSSSAVSGKRPSDEGRAEVATAAQLSSALLQEDSAQTMKETVDRGGEEGKEAIQEAAVLRKKYDELVAFTVQLTAKRDVLMSDLEKTRQLLQKASTDAMRVRKLSEESSTLRHRKNGAVNGKGGNEVSHAMTGKGSKDQGTYGPLHLVVCAIIFFLVGRYC